jgi:hypothetical protein
MDTVARKIANKMLKANQPKPSTRSEVECPRRSSIHTKIIGIMMIPIHKSTLTFLWGAARRPSEISAIAASGLLSSEQTLSKQR